MGHEHLRVEPGPAWRIVLTRPPLNILTIHMLDELADAVGGVGPEARVLVLTGEGKAFCAGVDVADHTAERVEAMIGSFAAAIRSILAAELPVVAAVNGAALGGGMELVLACDVVLARPGAKLGQPEIKLGVFPPAATALLPRRVGAQRALDLLLTGRTVTAEEAVDLGLVTRLVPDDDFEAGVTRYVDQLTGLSGPVLRLAKHAVVRGLELPIDDALESADRLYLNDLMDLHDPHEGLAAFMEKRDPVWRNE